MGEYGKRAEQLFMEGYNCSQAVLLSYSDITGLDDKTAAMLASGFGGGMGRMREVCGAVSGMFIVLGIVAGYSDPSDAQGKNHLCRNTGACFTLQKRKRQYNLQGASRTVKARKDIYTRRKNERVL